MFSHVNNITCAVYHRILPHITESYYKIECTVYNRNLLWESILQPTNLQLYTTVVTVFSYGTHFGWRCAPCIASSVVAIIIVYHFSITQPYTRVSMVSSNFWSIWIFVYFFAIWSLDHCLNVFFCCSKLCFSMV